MPKKKNTPRTTVNVDAVKRDVEKLSKQALSQDPNIYGGEAVPGSVRRESPLEQELGTAKYRQMIYDHNKKYADFHEKLPFTFPRKKVVRSHLSVLVECAGCGHQTVGSEHTIGIICSQCGKYNSVINPEYRKKVNKDETDRPGIFASALEVWEKNNKRS